MEIEQLITMWHSAVNTRDYETIAEIVVSDIELGGPRGSSSGLDTVNDWIVRSGITIADVTWHSVAPNVMVVEEAVMWPGNEDATPVFTTYRSNGKMLCSIHRYGDLQSALEHV